MEIPAPPDSERARALPSAVPGTPRSIVRPALDARLVAIGAIGGLLSGLLGVGGGIVMVPLLVLRAGYGQRDAHAVSLGAIIPISLASVLTYGIAGKIHPAVALALTVGAIAGARIGAGALARIDDRQLKLVFGLFLGAVAILMLVRL